MSRIREWSNELRHQVPWDTSKVAHSIAVMWDFVERHPAADRDAPAGACARPDQRRRRPDWPGPRSGQPKLAGFHDGDFLLETGATALDDVSAAAEGERRLQARGAL